MRIALAQIDPTVGAVAANRDLVLDAARRAADMGADLVVAPELALAGYPPEDLLAKEHFVEDVNSALAELARELPVATIVGFVQADGGALFNAAALCQAGRVRHVYRKRCLPNYGVFDERRYFEPGVGPAVVDIAGVPVAITICEDIWAAGPVEDSANAGARLVVNISASPFHTGKNRSREELLGARARDNGVWVAYCNLVGGQDELVFDGRSCVVDDSGEVVARAAAFASDLLFCEIGPAAGGVACRVEPEPGAEEEIHAALVLGLRDYVAKNGFSDVVIGLSGGIDSALTAAVAVDALGAPHVHGVTMPSRYSSAGSVDDSRDLAAMLGMDLIELSIEPVFTALLDTLAPQFEGLSADVTEENLQARARGMLLMALSNKFGWLVLATGNKSELSVGYSTLYGDMVGGFAPIKDVFKTRVYDLARWLNARAGLPVIPESTIEKPPSAELRPDQTDQDSLPSYDVLDAVLERYVERDMSIERIVADGFDESLVARVARMVDTAEYKRRQGPLGIRVTPKAFGRDRRMPVTNAYRG